MGKAPEPESTVEPEAEPKTLWPEFMTNQEAFLTVSVFIVALAVFCFVLLFLYLTLKKKFQKLQDSVGYGYGKLQMGLAEKKGYIA